MMLSTAPSKRGSGRMPTERGMSGYGYGHGYGHGLGHVSGIISYPTNYPGSISRLFPSITAATANPLGVMPETGNGLWGMGAVGDIVAWGPLPTEYAAIMASEDAATAAEAKAGSSSKSGIVPRAVQPDPVVPLPVSATTNAQVTGVSGLPGMSGGVGYTATARQKVADFARANYPGAVFVAAGARLPSVVGAHPPIVVVFPDGSFAYAPGYGPISQYGALQVANSHVPRSPRISAYTGRPVAGATLDVLRAFGGIGGLGNCGPNCPGYGIGCADCGLGGLGGHVGLGDTAADTGTITTLMLQMKPRYPELQYLPFGYANPNMMVGGPTGPNNLYSPEGIKFFTGMYGRPPDDRFRNSAFWQAAGTAGFSAPAIIAALQAIRDGQTPPPISLPGYEAETVQQALNAGVTVPYQTPYAGVPGPNPSGSGSGVATTTGGSGSAGTVTTGGGSGTATGSGGSGGSSGGSGSGSNNGDIFANMSGTTMAVIGGGVLLLALLMGKR